MSTIRRHGVAFHLLPTLTDNRWFEVIREFDGAVLVSREFHGDDTDFGKAVEEWLAAAVHDSVSCMVVPVCRVCGDRLRELQLDDRGRIVVDQLVEWEYDLCLRCAGHMERTSPWLRNFLLRRQRAAGDGDDW
jgi:hypothetical protein